MRNLVVTRSECLIIFKPPSHYITKAQVTRFTKARDTLSRRPNPKDLHPLIAKAQEDAVSGQLEEVKNDLREYEKLKGGQFRFDSLKLIAEPPHILVKARIARGLSQKDLAELIGLKEQQIQRYEATDYASASLSRIRDIAAALGAQSHQSAPIPRSPNLANGLETTAHACYSHSVMPGHLTSHPPTPPLAPPTDLSHFRDVSFDSFLESVPARLQTARSDELFSYEVERNGTEWNTFRRISPESKLRTRRRPHLSPHVCRRRTVPNLTLARQNCYTRH